jgi:hypothetical protein
MWIHVITLHSSSLHALSWSHLDLLVTLTVNSRARITAPK